MECTQMWWKCSEAKRSDIKYIIGIKDETIYSAFEVIDFEVETKDEKRLGRTIFKCGKSIDEIIGAKIEAKNRSALKYYDSEELFNSLNKDEKMKEYIMNYYKERGISYR